MLNEIYNFIFNQLKRTAPDFIRDGNMQAMTESDFSAKRAVSTSDFPEIQMGLVRVVGPLSSTSSHSKYELEYDISVASGDLTQERINDIMWWLMTRVQYLNMNRGIFDYKSSQPITSVTFSDSVVGLKVEEKMRSIVGFSSVSKIRVLVNVPHHLFIPTNCDNV